MLQAPFLLDKPPLLLLKITGVHICHINVPSWKQPKLPRSQSHAKKTICWFSKLKTFPYFSYWNPHFSWENHHFLVEHRFWHHLEECFGPGLNLRDAFAAALRAAAGLVDGIGGTPATGPGRAWETIGFPMLFSMVFHRFSMFFQVFHGFLHGFPGFPLVFRLFSLDFQWFSMGFP